MFSCSASCEVVDIMKGIMKECNSPYSVGNEDKADYRPNWWVIDSNATLFDEQVRINQGETKSDGHLAGQPKYKQRRNMLYLYIVGCQAHPALVKTGLISARIFHFKCIRLVKALRILCMSQVHLCTD